jgi:hypothetical protein
MRFYRKNCPTSESHHISGEAAMTTTDMWRRPRVWLVGAAGNRPEPVDRPVVRDTWMRTWLPGPDGVYHSTDGRHHATWTELHARYDLVEVA